MIKPIKVPISFKGTSLVFDEGGHQRPLREIVKLATENGYNPQPAPAYDTYAYEPPTSATRREIADYRRIMDSLKEPERFDTEV